ncbi:MAG TPA: hypothetical protein PKD64_02755 [Pirellulaceae bacterium]|nr:hypothetical protein [Pirellulaceae bacterium]HMO91090.1 hypothetical protein [Pirellulaceae bacterium]HMP71189.1 hypothetical protein [Pirellulaceae bacterium]
MSCILVLLGLTRESMLILGVYSAIWTQINAYAGWDKREVPNVNRRALRFA